VVGKLVLKDNKGGLQMVFIYKWWAQWEEFGNCMEEEKLFSSHAKMKLYSAEHAAFNGWDSSYSSGYDRLEVD